ncbi:hypothetical protein JL722_5794 [Aureococcus anophagefferens]|nr:hypothetical protein JL722_5794 [Aureococcus anophagefferens]
MRERGRRAAALPRAVAGDAALAVGARSLRALLLAEVEATQAVPCPAAPAAGDAEAALPDVLAAADGALGARSVALVFDARTHGAASLVHPALAGAQGPALVLWVDHDGPVGTEALVRLLSPGAAAVGRGLAGAFSLSDCLFALNRDTLHVFDPSGAFLDDGGGEKRPPGPAGRRYQLGDGDLMRKFPNQFEPFAHLPFGVSERGIAAGTILRLPLRGDFFVDGALDVPRVDGLLRSFEAGAERALLFGHALAGVTTHVFSGGNALLPRFSATRSGEKLLPRDGSGSASPGDARRRLLASDRAWLPKSKVGAFLGGLGAAQVFRPPALLYEFRVVVATYDGDGGCASRADAWLALGVLAPSAALREAAAAARDRVGRDADAPSREVDFEDPHAVALFGDLPLIPLEGGGALACRHRDAVVAEPSDLRADDAALERELAALARAADAARREAAADEAAADAAEDELERRRCAEMGEDRAKALRCLGAAPALKWDRLDGAATTALLEELHPCATSPSLVATLRTLPLFKTLGGDFAPLGGEGDLEALSPRALDAVRPYAAPADLAGFLERPATAALRDLYADLRVPEVDVAAAAARVCAPRLKAGDLPPAVERDLVDFLVEHWDPELRRCQPLVDALAPCAFVPVGPAEPDRSAPRAKKRADELLDPQAHEALDAALVPAADCRSAPWLRLLRDLGLKRRVNAKTFLDAAKAAAAAADAGAARRLLKALYTDHALATDDGLLASLAPVAFVPCCDYARGGDVVDDFSSFDALVAPGDRRVAWLGAKPAGARDGARARAAPRGGPRAACRAVAPLGGGAHDAWRRGVAPAEAFGALFDYLDAAWDDLSPAVRAALPSFALVPTDLDARRVATVAAASGTAFLELPDDEPWALAPLLFEVPRGLPSRACSSAGSAFCARPRPATSRPRCGV